MMVIGGFSAKLSYSKTVKIMQDVSMGVLQGLSLKLTLCQQNKTVTRIAIAEASPTASKVGASMFKRVAFYAKNPGVQMVGVMAATQLIEAIGWVMEDGAYVKKNLLTQTKTRLYHVHGIGQILVIIRLLPQLLLHIWLITIQLLPHQNRHVLTK